MANGLSIVLGLEVLPHCFLQSLQQQLAYHRRILRPDKPSVNLCPEQACKDPFPLCPFGVQTQVEVVPF